MTLGMFVAAILVGLLTGWLAGIVMKDGCYGLGWEVASGSGAGREKEDGAIEGRDTSRREVTPRESPRSS